MSNRTSQIFAAWTLGTAMLLSGCNSKPSGVAVRNQDGSITNPDGSVTYPAGSQQAAAATQPNSAPAGSVKNADGSVTVPAGSQPAAASAAAPVRAVAPATTPATSATTTAAPRATIPAEKPALDVPSGTRLDVSLSQTLSAKNNNVGDRFTGVLARPVTAGGTTVFARGTRVEGTVAAAKGRGRFKGAGDIGITLTSINGRQVSTTEYEKSQAGKGKRTGALIGGGGGAGALIGGLAGGGKGALIGALAGAGAGTAGAAYTGNKDVVIPAESVISFTTTSPIRVRGGGSQRDTTDPGLTNDQAPTNP